MNNIIDRILNSNGFDFPKSSEELELFDKQHEDYHFEANVYNVDPMSIINKHKTNLPVKRKNIEIHKRTVLAAEIVFQLHKEWSLGHVKLQKLIFLCMNINKMELHVNFLKQAMGPYDPHFKRSIIQQFKKNKWFEYKQESSQKFWPLENAGEHREWYNIYFEKESSDINALIETFKRTKTDQIELVATIYACWQKSLLQGDGFSEEIIINSVYQWSEEKIKFKENDIIQTIEWMLEKGIYPTS